VCVFVQAFIRRRGWAFIRYTRYLGAAGWTRNQWTRTLSPLFDDSDLRCAYLGTYREYQKLCDQCLLHLLSVLPRLEILMLKDDTVWLQPEESHMQETVVINHIKFIRYAKRHLPTMAILGGYLDKKGSPAKVQSNKASLSAETIPVLKLCFHQRLLQVV
jgi:hypothetical protein